MGGWEIEREIEGGRGMLPKEFMPYFIRKAADCQDAVKLQKQALEFLRRRRVEEYLLHPVLLLEAFNQISGSPQRFLNWRQPAPHSFFSIAGGNPPQYRDYKLHLIVEQLALLPVSLRPLARPLNNHRERADHSGSHSRRRGSCLLCCPSGS